MSIIVSLGIDLAKNMFALHGVDGAGKPVLGSIPLTRVQSFLETPVTAIVV